MSNRLDYKGFRYKLNHPKYKSYTYLAFSAGVSSLLIFFFIRPALTEITTLLKTIKSGKVLNEQLTVKLENLGKAEDKISQVNDNIYLIDKALPEILNTPNVIDSITQIATKNKVILQNIQIVSTTIIPEEFGEKIIISIDTNVTGNYLDLIAFTSNLEENLNLISIKSIAMNKSSTNYTASYSIEIYGYNFTENSVETKLVPFTIEKQ